MLAPTDGRARRIEPAVIAVRSMRHEGTIGTRWLLSGAPLGDLIHRTSPEGEFSTRMTGCAAASTAPRPGAFRAPDMAPRHVLRRRSRYGQTPTASLACCRGPRSETSAPIVRRRHSRACCPSSASWQTPPSIRPPSTETHRTAAWRSAPRSPLRPVGLELRILAPNPELGNRCVTPGVCPTLDARMKNLLLALAQLAVVTAKLCGPGGVRTVIAGESRAQAATARASSWSPAGAPTCR